MFNALKYIKNLELVGFQREQAEVQVQLVMDCFQENVATKSDVAGLRAELKTDMAELKADLVVKLGGIMIASITLATSVLGILIKF